MFNVLFSEDSCFCWFNNCSADPVGTICPWTIRTASYLVFLKHDTVFIPVMYRNCAYGKHSHELFWPNKRQKSTSSYFDPGTFRLSGKKMVKKGHFRSGTNRSIPFGKSSIIAEKCFPTCKNNMNARLLYRYLYCTISICMSLLTSQKCCRKNRGKVRYRN